MSMSAAKSRVMHARMQIESRRFDEVERTLDAAAGFLQPLTEDERAPVLAEIDELRAALPVHDGGRAWAARRPLTPVTSERDHANLLRARARVNQARLILDGRRTDGVEQALADAHAYLQEVPDLVKALLVAEIDMVRLELDAAVHVGALRRVRATLERGLAAAAAGLDDARLDDCARELALVDDVLAGESARRVVGTAELAGHEARARGLAIALAARRKTGAVAAALPHLDALERRLDGDPFAGLDAGAAYALTDALYELKQRVRRALQQVPGDDDQVKAIEARLRAADRTIDRASAAWGQAAREREVATDWRRVQADLDGWDRETVAPDAGPLDEPDLPRTRAAIQRLRYLLADPRTRRIRDEAGGAPAIEAAYREAEDMLDAAARKLHAAFNDVLDRAELVPPPTGRFELDRLRRLATVAEQAFAGTGYQARNVARALGLDRRWQAAAAARRDAQQARAEQLARAADARWPAIVEAVRPRALAPTAIVAGATVLLAGVYNRAGWDFDRRSAGFAMRRDGVPIAGRYEPHVAAALAEARDELGVEVDDQLRWDLIAIVEGMGTIGERTIVTLRDARTRLEIGTIEEHRPVACVRIRIVGLHAGPVAVGPAS
jgi:hypothetical protein